MAFLHCHGCNWEQDDFWTWRYNPLRCFMEDVACYWKPYWFEMDNYAVRDRGLKWTRMSQRGLPLVHSWVMLASRVPVLIRRAWLMQWWTFEAYRNAGRPGCPKCGHSLCVD